VGSAFLVGFISSLFFDFWVEIYVYPVSAFFFVLLGCLLSPLNIKYSTVLLVLVLAISASWYVGESEYPKTYEPTYLPLMCIVFASLLAALLAVAISRKKEND
jgi:hypothetical protein